MKATVFHKIETDFFHHESTFKPDEYREVAVVTLPNDYSDNENLELAYRFTNHIDEAWWENELVEVILHDDREPRYRSTSCGDVVKINDAYFAVAAAGWERMVS